ncbi:MAG: sigma-70 family RNA polymerase sigma factor [Deltaproteobacteria bacterium]|nr:sigma-70 family RNA polymerase sigma factor [Deltaproteobacteria bacterium]
MDKGHDQRKSHEFDVGIPGSRTITRLLERWSRGERQAAEDLMPLVYDELRSLARGYFRSERSDHTLQPTALVHEVFLRLAESKGIHWNDRTHFYGLAACLMRRALVDYSRYRTVAKRGGQAKKAPLEESVSCTPLRPQELIAIDDALLDLERMDPLKALIVELKFFGGLSTEQTAKCIGQSPRTVARHWRRARAWLFTQVSEEGLEEDHEN